MAVTNFAGEIGVTANFRYTTTVNGSTVVVTEAQPTTGASRRFSAAMIDLPYVVAGSGLAAAGTVDIDLSAAGFSSIKMVAVFLTSTTGQLKVGGAGPANVNSLWFADDSDAMTIHQGGPPFLQGSSTAVTVDGSNKDVRLTNTHGSEAASYEVWVWGVD